MLEFTRKTPNVWYPDQEEPVYDPNDPVSEYQFKEYWKREKDRCINGFYLADGQVRIPGRLYFHTVYFQIARYVEINRGGKKVKNRIIDVPTLRDIDWDIFNDLEDCIEQGRFYNLCGSRDFGKSVIAASCAAWLYTFVNNSESVISSSESTYIKLVFDKIEDGLLNIHPLFKKQRLTSDWKREIRAGWKDKSTNLPAAGSTHSRILNRNYEMGTKTMAANGTRPGFHLIDEEGTLPNLIACIKDSDGCWWSGEGDKPSCLVMVTGTGGNMDVGAEAAEIFFNPEAYNFLSFDNHWENGNKIGRFIPATRVKMKYKYPKTLAEYIGVSHPDLEKIVILVSDEEETKREWWDGEYAKAKKSGNPKAILKFKAYWPLKPSDSFIVLAKNDFNVEAAKVQQARIRNNGITGSAVEIYHDGEKLQHRFSEKLPITEFPARTQSKDAPVIMWEPPVSNPPFGLYIAGADPYRFDSSSYSDSLGAIYIYKRTHNILSEKYQDMFVACYVARPSSQDTWNENARNLLKYYNALCLCENDEMSFINFMISKNEGHYLHDQPDWLTEIVPNTKVKHKKGIHRSSKQVRTFLDGCLKRYLDDVLDTEKDEHGAIIKETLGVSRMMDPMALEEIIKFNQDEGNYDRIIAIECALALAEKMKPLGTVNTTEEDPRYKALYNTDRKKQQLFAPNRGTFSSRKRRTFI